MATDERGATPSPDDLSRDLRADLWMFEGQSDRALAVRFLDTARDAGRTRRFVDDARIGWPAAIRRAIAAEARVADLEADNADLRRQLAALQPQRDGCGFPYHHESCTCTGEGGER